jgi:hypothetical protein
LHRGASAFEEQIQLGLMLLRVPDKADRVSSGMLHREICDSKHLPLDMFSHQQTAYFAAAGFAQLTLQALDDRRSQKQLHSNVF